MCVTLAVNCVRLMLTTSVRTRRVGSLLPILRSLHDCSDYLEKATCLHAPNAVDRVKDLKRICGAFCVWWCLQAMAEVGMPLLIHGEVTTAGVDIFDKEARFIEEVIKVNALAAHLVLFAFCERGASRAHYAKPRRCRTGRFRSRAFASVPRGCFLQV